MIFFLFVFVFQVSRFGTYFIQILMSTRGPLSRHCHFNPERGNRVQASPPPKKKMLQRRKRLIWFWNIQFASFYSESATAAPLSPPPRGWLRRRDSRTWIRCHVPSVAQTWHVKDVSVVVAAAADGRVDLWTLAFIFRPSVNCRGTAYSDSCLNRCLGCSVTLTTVTFKGIKECGSRLQHWRFFFLCILTNIVFFCLYFQFI